MTDRPFAPAEQRWLAGLGTVRDVVRQTLVGEQVEAALALLPPGPKRVLDVGCGQGTQALRVARLGHDVVGLDPSPDLLDRFRADLDGEPPAVRDRVRLVVGPGQQAPDLAGPLAAGGFDLVLCHGVLMYLDDDAPMLAALAAVVRPGGLLSLLVRNGVGLAMRPGLLGDWTQVHRALDGARYTNRLGLDVRAHTPAGLDAALAPHGLTRRRWWGVRTFTDHLDGPPPEGAALDELLGAERAVAGVDPYRQVAALAHLVHARA